MNFCHYLLKLGIRFQLHLPFTVILTVKKIFPDVQMKPSVFQPVPITSCPVTGHHWRKPDSVFWHVFFRDLSPLMRFPLNLLFCRLDVASAVSLSPCDLCCRALLPFSSMSVWGWPRAGCSTPGVLPPELSREEGSSPSSSWRHSKCSPGHLCPPLGALLACVHFGVPSCGLWSWFPAGPCPAFLVHFGVTCGASHLAVLNCVSVLSAHLCSLSGSPGMTSRPSGASASPPSLCHQQTYWDHTWPCYPDNWWWCWSTLD